MCLLVRGSVVGQSVPVRLPVSPCLTPDCPLAGRRGAARVLQLISENNESFARAVRPQRQGSRAWRDGTVSCVGCMLSMVLQVATSLPTLPADFAAALRTDDDLLLRLHIASTTAHDTP